jgi:hypothetical protein
MRGEPVRPAQPQIERHVMVERRIKPYREQVAEQEQRSAQTRVYRRNQIFGVVLVASAVCLWWLFHTNPKWIFPVGWWRP